MRVLSLVAVVVLSGVVAGCAGYHSSPSAGEQSAELPTQGGDAIRDGFYDGGIFDPDLTPRAMRLPE